MTVAIPTWEGRVSPLLDVAGRLTVVRFENGRETGRRVLSLERSDPTLLAQSIMETGSDVLVCGALSQELAICLTKAEVRVIPHICGEIEDVLSALVGNTLSLPQFKMPGCCAGRCLCHGHSRRRFMKK